ncbi:hypothetical protein RUND412_010945 [Rhizina undulata]
MIVRTVEKSVQKLYPIAFVDNSWDNTGLILEAPYNADMKVPRKPIVLLTIDLTRSVVEEPIKLRSPVIVTYHPIIFRLLKSLTCNDTQQESFLRLVQAGFEDCGMGIVLILYKAMRFGDLVARSWFRLPKDIAMALQCSSGGMLRKTNADLYLTGELSYHEAFAANEKETSTITSVMKPKLQQVLKEEWGKVDL